MDEAAASVPGWRAGLEPRMLRAAGILVGVMFLVAAAGKALAPLRFSMVVDHVLSGLGLSAVPAQGVVPVLIFTEALLGGLFVLGIAGRRTRWTTVALIALFSFVLLWMWKRPPAQGCGCVGFWTFPNNPRHEMLLGLARNIGLIMCVSVQMGDGVALARPPVGRVQPRPARRGVTVIETLCVIAVIVVLVAIILPHLAGSRRAARRVTELAGAREMYGALTMYGRDYTDAFPFCATPGEIDGPLTLYGASFQGRFFTAQSKLFVNLLAPSYLSSTKELVVVDRDYNANSGMPPQVMQSEVWLTYTAFSRPSYWVGAQPPDGGTLLCGGRWSDVGFPSSKGLLLDLRTHNRQTTGQEPKEALVLWGIVWGDGSGVIRPVDVDHRYRTVVRPNAMFDWPVLATEEGLAGRDFEEPTPAPGPP